VDGILDSTVPLPKVDASPGKQAASPGLYERTAYVSLYVTADTVRLSSSIEIFRASETVATIKHR
jgi:hypothetical protein